MKNALPNSNTAFRIVVVGREVLTGHLLAEALGRSSEFEASAATSTQLASALAVGAPDLIVISADLYGGQCQGMELVRTVNRKHPGIAIIVLLDEPDRETVIKAFRCGARGVVSHLQDTADLIACIEHVRGGGIWAAKTEADYLLEALRSIPAPSLSASNTSASLTRRESQVVSCAAQGKTNKTIANELTLSEHTVKNYLFRAFEKLGVSSRIELLFYLTTQGRSFGRTDLRAVESKRAQSSYHPEAIEQHAR